jgi:hypothetical protein
MLSYPRHAGGARHHGLRVTHRYTYCLSAPLTIPLVYCHINSFRRASSCGEVIARRRKEDRRAGLASRRLGRCSSRMRPLGCPCSRWGAGAVPRLQGQPWTSAVTLLPGCNGLSARRMVVLWAFRVPSLGRHVHREFMHSALLDLTPILSATACHQRNYVERYSRCKTALVKA